MESGLLMLVGGMLASAILLSLGAVVGYWAGAQANDRQVLVQAAPPIEQPSSALMEQLARSIEASQQLTEQSEVLISLARAVVDPPPTALTAAVDRLVETARGLAAHLKEAAQPTATPQVKVSSVETMPTSHSPQVERSVPAPDRPVLKIVYEAPARRSSLTNEEISKATGGRHEPDEIDPETRRYAYDCHQQFAWWEQGEPGPSIDNLAPVRCHDISVSGISFFLPKPPDCERLVISVGAGDKLIFMAAQVCHHKSVFMHGELCYLVGCRFMNRLDELTAQWVEANGLVGVA